MFDRLGLKDQQEREIVHVLVDCCLQEKTYNPFYAFLAGRLCDSDRRLQVTARGRPSRVSATQRRRRRPEAGGRPFGFTAPRPVLTFFSAASAEVREMTATAVSPRCHRRADPGGHAQGRGPRRSCRLGL